MVVHLNMDKEHVLKHTGVFECEGQPLHGKTFVLEQRTPRAGIGEYKETEKKFYLSEPGSPSFPSMKELVKFYQPSIIITAIQKAQTPKRNAMTEYLMDKYKKRKP